MKKLIPALALLVVSAVLMGTSTFAWFSLNNKVTVTGMTVSTKVGDSLLIAGSATATNTKEAESAFKRNYVANINALLEPVSTVDGVDFFYNSTANVAADGNAIVNNDYVVYNADSAPTNAELTDFNTNYGTTGAVGFVDYAFQIKAFNSNTSSPAFVNMTQVKLTYAGSTQDQKAFRVAVFVNDMGAAGGTNGTVPTSSSLLSILRPSGAAYFDGDKAVSAYNADPTAVDGKIDDKVVIDDDLGAGETNYYKVVVRLWLEGEDTTCTNTKFASLTNEWALDISVEIQANNTLAVNSLEQAETASLIDLSADSASGTTKVIDGTTYYQLTTNTTYYTNTASLGQDSRIFVIDANNHPTEVTSKCTLPGTIDLASATISFTDGAIDYETIDVNYYKLSVDGYYTTDPVYTSSSKIFRKDADGHMTDVTSKCTLTSAAKLNLSTAGIDELADGKYPLTGTGANYYSDTTPFASTSKVYVKLGAGNYVEVTDKCTLPA